MPFSSSSVRTRPRWYQSPAIDAAREAKELAEEAESEAQELLARQQALLPPQSDPDIALRVEFPGGAVELDESAESELAGLAETLRSSERPNVEIRTYWSSEAEESSKAKMSSLKRGMLVRSYLRSQGILFARIVLHEIAEDQGSPHLIDIVTAGR